ncbi:MAG: DUF922 domain-containing protein [Flavobacteriales bacterium]|nr:DUF922 domain-containing protein [Flavobacteriales bacterium]
MRILLIFTSLLFLSFSFTSTGEPLQSKGNYVDWTEGKLNWKQFKGKVPSGTPFAALTYSAIDLQLESEGNSLSIFINTIFDPKLSWKKKDVNDYLLAHEQLHFDITEYHSRLLRKELQSIKFKSFDSIGDQVQEVFMKISQDADDMQEEYDSDTDHSKVKRKQLEWNDKVKSLLKETKDYADKRIQLDISYLN